MENEIPGHKMSSILLYQLLPSTATKVSYDIKKLSNLQNLCIIKDPIEQREVNQDKEIL